MVFSVFFYECGDQGLQKFSPDLGGLLAHVLILDPSDDKVIYRVAFSEQ